MFASYLTNASLILLLISGISVYATPVSNTENPLIPGSGELVTTATASLPVVIPDHLTRSNLNNFDADQISGKRERFRLWAQASGVQPRYSSPLQSTPEADTALYCGIGLLLFVLAVRPSRSRRRIRERVRLDPPSASKVLRTAPKYQP